MNGGHVIGNAAQGQQKTHTSLERVGFMFKVHRFGTLYFADVHEVSRSRRKLPHQVDNSKLEIPVLNVLGMNSMGVLSPRESWGLNSL